MPCRKKAQVKASRLQISPPPVLLRDKPLKDDCKLTASQVACDMSAETRPNSK
jgi:hypothetical protein